MEGGVKEGQESLRTYLFGFLLSLGFTLTAYILVALHLLPRLFLILTIFALAISQTIVQLILFLHLGESRPRWDVSIFLFMLLVVLVIVLGSLWIMYSLNYRVMGG